MVAKRYFFGDFNSIQPTVSPTFSDSWTIPGTEEVLRKSLTSSIPDEYIRQRSVTVSASGRAFINQWISEPFTESAMIGTSLTIAQKGRKWANGGSAIMRAMVSVWSEVENSTKKILYLDAFGDAVAFTYDPGDPRILSTTIDSYVVDPGDRIVVELGYDVVVTSSFSVYVISGGKSSNSLLDPTVYPVTGEVPWIEFDIQEAPDPPGIPTNLTASINSPSSFSISWNESSLGTSATSYDIQSTNLNDNVPAETNTYTFTNLSHSISHVAQVRSVNEYGTSEWVSITVSLPAPPPMVPLIWDDPNPRYHYGVDKGVLYPRNGPGVAWNGLISVEDTHVGNEIEALHIDGVKYYDLVKGSNYQANLNAFSTPEEFGPCSGELEILDGLILTRQRRERFGLSYRTMIGNDLGYRIHLIYNAMAKPMNRGYKTLTNQPEPSNRSWSIDAVPVESDAPKPTAHYILDSTEIESEPLAAVESLLYGTHTRAAYLPDIKQITAILSEWKPRVIHPNPTSGLAALIPADLGDVGDVQEVHTDGIYILLPGGRLTESSINGLYLLTE